MRTFVAIAPAEVVWGGWMDVCRWASEHSLGTSSPVKIATARGGDRSVRVIAEAVAGEVLLVRSGRVYPVRKLGGPHGNG